MNADSPSAIAKEAAAKALELGAKSVIVLVSTDTHSAHYIHGMQASLLALLAHAERVQAKIKTDGLMDVQVNFP